MATFTLPKQNWDQIKPLLARLLPFLLLASVGPLAMAYAFSPNLEILLFLLALLIVVTAIGITLGVYTVGRQKYILEYDKITFSRPFYEDVTISKASVSSITEDNVSGLTIRDASSGDSIFIPNHLIGYEELRTQLNTWLPIGRPPRTHNRHLIVITTLIAISSLAALGGFVFRVRFFLLVFALSLFAVLIYGFVLSSKEKSPRPKTTPVFNRIVLGFVIIYFLYEIITSVIE